MNILFELSKEHPTLPQKEISTCLNSENISYTINEKNNDILNIYTNTDIDLIKEIVSRLSYTFYVDELFFSCSKSIKEIKKISQLSFLFINCLDMANEITNAIIYAINARNDKLIQAAFQKGNKRTIATQ